MSKQVITNCNIEDLTVEWPSKLLPYMSNEELYKMLEDAAKGEFVTYDESIRRNAPWRKN